MPVFTTVSLFPVWHHIPVANENLELLNTITTILWSFSIRFIIISFIFLNHIFFNCIRYLRKLRSIEEFCRDTDFVVQSKWRPERSFRNSVSLPRLCIQSTWDLPFPSGTKRVLSDAQMVAKNQVKLTLNNMSSFFTGISMVNLME